MSATDLPPPESPTSTLHLSKIISRKDRDEPTTTRSEEGPTLVIKKAAAQVAQQAPQHVVMPKQSAQAVPPRQMLGAVAYAYAKGVYRSEDIEERMLKDPNVREALGGEVPDAQAIRRFRYLNRDALLATLERFYFWRRKKGARAAAAAASIPPTTTGGGESQSTLFVRREAAERLNEAACVDNNLKD